MSSLKRAADVRDLHRQYYEPGRHDRCKRWIYRNHIYPRFGISITTYFRYLNETTEPRCSRQEDPRQLRLFD
jgi:hypothetical protein